MKTTVSLLASLLVSVSGISDVQSTCVQHGVRVQQNVVCVPQRIVKQHVTVLQQVTPHAYWSVSDQYKSEAEAERISELVIQKLIKKNIAIGNQPGQSTQPSKPEGLAILQKSCMKCHSPTSKAVVEKKAVKLFDANGNLTVSEQEIGSILTVIRKGIMPPTPIPALTDDEYLAVKSYLGTGTPPVAAPATQQAPPQPEQPGPANP